MSLLSICQNPLNEIGEYEVPSSIIGNSNGTATQMLALAQSVGKYLTRKHDLTDLLLSYTFDTVASQAAYALPAGFRKFSNQTFWDDTNDWQLLGPATPAQWQQLQSSNITATSRSYFRIAAKQMEIFPTPTAVETLAYQYYSDNWCQSSAGVGQTAWAADTDEGVIDEYFLEREIKWRFLSAKGLPYEDEMKEADDIRAAHIANDGAAPTIVMDRETFGVLGHNFPEQGFGS